MIQITCLDFWYLPVTFPHSHTTWLTDFGIQFLTMPWGNYWCYFHSGCSSCLCLGGNYWYSLQGQLLQHQLLHQHSCLGTLTYTGTHWLLLAVCLDSWDYLLKYSFSHLPLALQPILGTLTNTSGTLVLKGFLRQQDSLVKFVYV